MIAALEHLPADVFGLAPIARAALGGRPRPAALPGTLVPGEVAALPRPAERFEPRERRALAGALERHLARYEPHVAVIESARALAEPGACLVLAGQQPGFLGGPLFNVYKALHVVRLARALSEAWGVRVVPGFWNHADDHDVAEVHHLWVQNENLDLRKVALPGLSSGRVPLSAIRIDREGQRLGPLAELLRQVLPAGEHRDAALELFLPRDGESLAGAFTRVLLTLFGPLGLVVVEPDWIRERLSRALAHLVTADLAGELARGRRALAPAGVEPGIDPAAGALVYRLREGRRHALRLGERGFAYDDEPGARTPAELAAEIVQEPEGWSPGALLRPLAQDLALPVAAYVGGWGELAYLAELPPLREHAGVPATPFVPRLSATLVDPEVRASLERLGLAVADVLAARGRLGEDAGEAPAVAAALRAVARRARAELAGLGPDLAELDRGLAAQLARSGRQIEDAVLKLAQKAERVAANLEGRGRRHQRRVANGLVPREAPQERVRGALEFVARFGTGWLSALERELEPFPTEHLVVHLDDNAP